LFYYLPSTFNTQHMLDSIYLSQSVSLSPSSHSLLTFPSSLPSFHNLPSAVLSTVLDIQHFWKPFTFTSGEMLCHPHWLNNTLIFLGLWIYLNPWRLKIFTTDGVNGVQNWNTCVLDFSCHVCGLSLISLSSWHILWFVICWLVQISFFGLVASSFLNSHFPVTAFGLYLLSGGYLNKFLFL